LIYRYFGVEVNKETRLEFLKIKESPFSYKQLAYGAEDIIYPLEIKQLQKERIANANLYNTVTLEHNFIPVLGDIEYKGMNFNKEKWKQIYEKNLPIYNSLIIDVNAFVVKYYPDSKFISNQLNLFNSEQKCNILWSSPKQTVDFFRFLNACPQEFSKQTKKLEYTVNAKVLLSSLYTINKDKPQHIKEFIKLYIKLKETEQKCTTFGLEFFEHINPITKRVHSNFRQILNTGRISSTDPNLQNIPSDEEYRKCFDAPEGYDIVNSDYSGQETVVITNLSQEKNMMNLILNDGDMHCFVTKALHPELKVTEKYFMEQMKAGKVLSAELLPELAKAYEKLYGIENVKRAETLQAAQERMANAWTDLVRHLNESPTNGIGAFFSFIMNGLTNATKALDNFLSSWNILQKESLGKGISEGAKMLKQYIGDAKGEEANKIALEKQIEARQILLGLREKESKLIKKVNDWRKLGGTSVGSEMSEEELRKIQYNIGIYSSIIKESKNFLQPKTNATPNGVVETESQKKKRLSAELKIEKDASKSREQLLKDEYNLKMSNLEREKELIKDFRDNKETSLEDMLFLEQAFAYKEIQISQAVYEEDLRLAKENNALQTIALNKFLTAKENAIKESQDRQIKSQEDFTKEQLQKTKDWYAKNPPIGIFETSTSKGDRDDELSKKRQQLKDTVKLFNEFAGDFANKSGFSQTFENFFKENKDGVSLFDKMFDKDSMMTTEERTLAMFQTISSAAQDTMNLISESQEQKFQRSLIRLEQEKETALGFAGDSAAARTKIEEDYDKKKKAIEVREFKRKQKMTLANIAMDTAQAVMSIMSTGGGTAFADFGVSAGILTAFTIGLGLAQAGMVLSQQPPNEYWVGTDNAEAGLAFTQERGAEIITDKKGNIKDFGSNKGARLTMMEEGDKVFNAEKTKRMMFNNELNSIMMDNGISNAPKIVVNSGMTKAEMREVMMETLGEQPQYHSNFDANGASDYIVKKGNITRSASNRGNSIKTRFT